MTGEWVLLVSAGMEGEAGSLGRGNSARVGLGQLSLRSPLVSAWATPKAGNSDLKLDR